MKLEIKSLLQVCAQLHTKRPGHTALAPVSIQLISYITAFIPIFTFTFFLFLLSDGLNVSDIVNEEPQIKMFHFAVTYRGAYPLWFMFISHSCASLRIMMSIGFLKCGKIPTELENICFQNKGSYCLLLKANKTISN